LQNSVHTGNLLFTRSDTFAVGCII